MTDPKQQHEPVAGHTADPEGLVREMQRIQTGSRIRLVLPEDLYQLYREALINRLKPFGIRLEVIRPGDPVGAGHAADYQLAFGWAPDDDAEPPPEDTAGFPVTGVPPMAQMMPLPRPEIRSTEPENRFLQLRTAVETMVTDVHFVRLTEYQRQIREKLQAAQAQQALLEQIIGRISEVDAAYYQCLAFFLAEAVDRVSQLVTLGDVMRRYSKICIVDDMGERIRDRLEEWGFRKRFLSTMSSHAFHQAFKEFRDRMKEEAPDEEANWGTFFTRCSLFDEPEIVVFNAWKIDGDSLPIQISLKQKPDLTRREINQLKADPDIKIRKIEATLSEYQQLAQQLQLVEKELRAAETGGGLSESAYVALNKKRKRILIQLNRKNDELKGFQKQISDRPKLTVYTRDLLAAVADRKTARKILALQGAVVRSERGKAAAAPLVSLKVEDIKALADLVPRKTAAERQIRQLNAETRSLFENMTRYARQHPLDPKMGYEQILGVHALNCLEMAVLGCGIARLNEWLHIYPGPYFPVTLKRTVRWEADAFSRVRLFIATRNLGLSTRKLGDYFRIPASDVSERIEISPVLPTADDFDNGDIDLVILNYASFPGPDIADCLKRRNRSRRAEVPVLILDADNVIEKTGQRHLLDLLIGLKKGADDSLCPVTPLYRLPSLEDDCLFPMLSAVLGVEGVPEPAAALIDGSEQPGALPGGDWLSEIETPAITADGAVDKLSGPPLTAEAGRKGKIDVRIVDPAVEQVYSLGALFSFEDRPDRPTDPTDGAAEDKSRAMSNDAGPKPVVPEEPAPSTSATKAAESSATRSESKATQPDETEEDTDVADGSHLF